MTAKVLMVQGTASHVGKSVMVAALCRMLRQDGFKVAPFKAQTMSLNSFVTPDGLEIGRAQAVQAEAAGIEPSVEMNPILLKPERGSRSQVVVLGKPLMSTEARDYFDKTKPQLWDVVATSLDRLRTQYEVVVIEGAGSPAEVNLSEREIVNMRVARHAEAPVLLVADIDRGGVFASLVGTLDLLAPRDRGLVKGLVVNKFRGDVRLFDSGVSFLEERTGLPVVGVVPYFREMNLPEEDSVPLESRRGVKSQTGYILDVAVIRLPHIANFDDFDPLAAEEGVRLRYVERGDELGAPDLVILPGSKTTMADLEYVRSVGLDQEIVSKAAGGTAVIGICGGYQMLGERLLDPLRVESPAGEAVGLGLLPVTTTFSREKETHRIKGEVVGEAGLVAEARGSRIEGYEIHMGRTFGEDLKAPFRVLSRSGRATDERDGAMSVDGGVMGTYIHGLFHNSELRRGVLGWLAKRKGVALPPPGPERVRDDDYDRWAAVVREALDMELVYGMMGVRTPS